jgi:predicted metal-binding protein
MEHAELTRFLIAAAMRCGAENAAVVSVEKIPFRREFRAACEQNTCGKHGTCWMCPPDVGDIDEMIARAKRYGNALVFQSIGSLEDSFDIEGMQDAAKRHNDLAQTLARELAPVLKKPLRLGAGACHVCDRCACRDHLPCRHPEQAVASLEAYGIAVSELAALADLNYINGQNTVTYFGGFLF